MNVKNRKCIRKLSLKSLYANRRRNLIVIFAIALTTLLFTSMFTICFYNEVRPHATLKYKTPQAFEAAYTNDYIEKTCSNSGGG